MYKVFLAIVLWVLSPWVVADAVDELIAELSAFDSLQGQFRQRQHNDQGEFMQESSGRFALLRPGYFSWEIVAPDSQLLVANPEFIWHHDRDLETVTRRPATVDGQISPLQVLGGDEAAIRAHFSVTSGSPGVFSLTPMAQEAAFRALTLTLANGALTTMQVTDNLGQQLDIQFIDTRRNTGLTDTDFAFVPPPGADLFYHEQ